MRNELQVEKIASYKEPIVFSNGMSSTECETYYNSSQSEPAFIKLLEKSKSGKNSLPRRMTRMFVRKKRGKGYASSRVKSLLGIQDLEFDEQISATCCESRDSFYSISSSKENAGNNQQLMSSLSLLNNVSFDPIVTVHTIPSHSTYSKRMWTSQWSSPIVAKKNEMRNRLEFEYDKFDWRNATEESGMIIDPETKILIHPVHGNFSKTLPKLLQTKKSQKESKDNNQKQPSISHIGVRTRLARSSRIPLR